MTATSPRPPSWSKPIVDRLVDLRADIHADARRAGVFDRATANIRRPCREADDYPIAGDTSGW